MTIFHPVFGDFGRWYSTIASRYAIIMRSINFVSCLYELFLVNMAVYVCDFGPDDQSILYHVCIIFGFVVVLGFVR